MDPQTDPFKEHRISKKTSRHSQPLHPHTSVQTDDDGRLNVRPVADSLLPPGLPPLHTGSLRSTQASAASFQQTNARVTVVVESPQGNYGSTGTTTAPHYPAENSEGDGDDAGARLLSNDAFINNLKNTNYDWVYKVGTAAMPEESMSSRTKKILVVSVLLGVMGASLYIYGSLAAGAEAVVGGTEVNEWQNTYFSMQAIAGLLYWHEQTANFSKAKQISAIGGGAIAGLANGILDFVNINHKSGLSAAIPLAIANYIGSLPMSVFGMVCLFKHIEQCGKDDPKYRQAKLDETKAAIDNLSSLDDAQKAQLKALCTLDNHGILYNIFRYIIAAIFASVMCASITGYICAPLDFANSSVASQVGFWAIGIISNSPTAFIIALQASLSNSDRMLKFAISAPKYIYNLAAHHVGATTDAAFAPPTKREFGYFALKATVILTAFYFAYNSYATAEGAYDKYCPDYLKDVKSINWFVTNFSLRWGTVLFNWIMSGPVVKNRLVSHFEQKYSTGFERFRFQISETVDYVKTAPIATLKTKLNHVDEEASTASQSSRWSCLSTCCP